MNKYLKTQIELFKESFKIKKFSLNVVIELSKYLVLLIILTIGLAIILKSIYSVMPLLNSVESIKDIPRESVPKDMLNKIIEQKSLLNNMLVSVFSTLLVMIILSSFVTAYFNLIITNHSNNKKLESKRLLNLFLIYSIFGLLFATIFTLVLVNSYNLLAILFTLVGLIILRMYFYTAYLVSIHGKNFLSDFKQGFIHKIKIHRTFIPIIVGILLFLTSSLILIQLIDIMMTYVLIPTIIFLASWSIWMKNYQTKIYEYYTHKKE